MAGNGILGLTFASLLIDLLAFTSILPLFPRILQHYLVNQSQVGLFGFLYNGVNVLKVWIHSDQKDLDIVLFGGILGSLFSILQFICSPLIGYYSDKFGKRPVLLCCTIGTCISYCLWLFADDFSLFLLSRAMGGMSKGIVQISTSIVADVTSPESRTKGMVMIGVAFSIGFTIGPALGAYFASVEDFFHLHPFSNASLFSLTLSILDLIFIYFFIPETMVFKKKEKETTNKSTTISPNLIVQNALNKLYLVHFLFLFLFSGIEFNLTFLTFHRFDYSNMQNGKLLGYIGILSAIVQGTYLRRKSQNEQKMIQQGILSLILSAFILGIFDSELMLYVGVSLFSFSSAVVVSSLNSMTSKLAAQTEKGTKLGYLRSGGQLGRAFGPLIISIFYWAFGPLLTFSTTGILLLIPLSIFMKIRDYGKVE